MLSRVTLRLAAIVAIFAPTSVCLGQASVSTDFLSAGGEVIYPLFLTTGQVGAMMTTPTGSLPTNFTAPDTRLQIRDTGGVSIADNDDAGTGGDAVGAASVSPVRGSASRYLATGTGAYSHRVYGFNAAAAGSFIATRAVFMPGVGPWDFVDSEPNDTAATAQVLGLTPGTAWIGTGSLTAGDLDMFAIAMSPGYILSAMTIPLSSLPTNFSAVDTRLDLRAADGTTIIATNDDGGSFSDAVGASSVSPVRGSVVRYLATSSDTINLTVRGFGATDVGDYALLVSLVPEPSSLTLLALGGLFLIRRHTQ